MLDQRGRQARQKRARWFLGYQIIGGLLGWVWLLSIPLNLGAFVYSVGFGGPWRYLLFSFLIGALAKFLARVCYDHLDWLGVETHLVEIGLPEAVARQLFFTAHAEGGMARAKELYALGPADVQRDFAAE